MTTTAQPNPPSRKAEDFPKTNTMPDGWVLDSIMEMYNSTGSVNDHGTAVDLQSVSLPQAQASQIPVPTTGGHPTQVNGRGHSLPEQPHASADEGLFSRRLDPFPSARDLNGMGL